MILRKITEKAEQKETVLASLALGYHAGHLDGVHCPGARCEHVTVKTGRLLRTFADLGRKPAETEGMINTWAMSSPTCPIVPGRSSENARQGGTRRAVGEFGPRQ